MSSHWHDNTAPGTAERPHLYPVALVPPLPGAAPARYANLVVASPDALLAPEDDWNDETPVAVIQMACSCGWRSPLLETPPETRCVTPRVGAAVLLLVPDAFHRQCQALWKAHRAPTWRPQ
jgi:hypothetical protein